MGITKKGWLKRKKNGKGIPWNKGIKMPNLQHAGQFKKGMSGKNNLNWKGGLPFCACGKKLSTYTGKMCAACHTTYQKNLRGKNHFNWIEDRTKIKVALNREDANYKIWRAEVYKRDNFKCKISNEDCEGKIEAHHILSWKDYPELRYEVNNGITVCHFHHAKCLRKENEWSEFFQHLLIKNVA